MSVSPHRQRGEQGVMCRCRNLADEDMPPSVRIGDREARRLGLWRSADCPDPRHLGHAMTTDLTPAQAARLEAIEAAPWAEVRLSPNGRDVAIRRGDNDWRVSNGGHYRDLHVADWLPMAVAAIDVMRGAADDGAVGR